MALASIAPTDPQSRTELAGALTGLAIHPARTVELGIWLGILTVDLELSDYGAALRWLAAGRADRSEPTQPTSGVDEFLLWLLLRQDTLLLALLQEWFEQTFTGSPHIEVAIGRLLADARAVAEPDHLVPAMHLSEFVQELEAKSDRPARALAARLEILAELGMVHDCDEDPSGVEPDPRLRSLMSGLQGWPLTRDGARSFLDERYFSCLVAGTSRTTEKAETTDRALLRLVQAYLAIRRPLGFTPGRPISLLACCTALLTGTATEVRDAYDCAYAAAESRWSEYLHFSGGSRFDREFLIRIDPVLEEHLCAELGDLPRSA